MIHFKSEKRETALSRTSALIGLSECVWNECIIIIISKCEEQ